MSTEGKNVSHYWDTLDEYGYYKLEIHREDPNKDSWTVQEVDWGTPIPKGAERKPIAQGLSLEEAIKYVEENYNVEFQNFMECYY